MLRQIRTKVRLPLALMLLLSLLIGLEGCKGWRARRAKARAAWQQRQRQASERSPARQGPLTDQELARVVQAARSYIGTPYLSGGTTRTGMDCSGLVVVAYQQVNKTLPRISYQQAEAGTPIGVEDIAAGDLVFFTDRKGNSRITHVGLVTEVKDRQTIKFIHTTNSLGVVENNLKQPYWSNLLVKAVRVR